ncbi:hypothetical protein ACNOYE_07915 [Nannocystaceae bacterium ST9]
MRTFSSTTIALLLLAGCVRGQPSPEPIEPDAEQRVAGKSDKPRDMATYEKLHQLLIDSWSEFRKVADAWLAANSDDPWVMADVGYSKASKELLDAAESLATSPELRARIFLYRADLAGAPQLALEYARQAQALFPSPVTEQIIEHLGAFQDDRTRGIDPAFADVCRFLLGDGYEADDTKACRIEVRESVVLVHTTQRFGWRILGDWRLVDRRSSNGHVADIDEADGERESAPLDVSLCRDEMEFSPFRVLGGPTSVVVEPTAARVHLRCTSIDVIAEKGRVLETLREFDCAPSKGCVFTGPWN